MTQFYDATEASRVLTLEEITSLTEDSGKPADTLMNVVALIARALSHRCLFGLSSGAGSL